MNSEQRYELQKAYEALQEVEAKLEEQEENIQLEKHFALVDNREPQLYAYYFGYAKLIEQKRALEERL